MKTSTILFSVALVTGVAAYACAADGASTAATPQSSSSTLKDAEKLAAMPITTLAEKAKASTDKMERRHYIGALYRVNPTTEKDVATLAALAEEDGGKGVASSPAFVALEKAGAKDKALAPAYLKLLDSKNARVQIIAMEKCGTFRSKEAWPKLIKIFKSTDKNSTSQDGYWRLQGVIVALGKYGKDGLPDLLKLREEFKGEVMGKLVEGAIQAIDDKEAAPQFMEIVRNTKEKSEIRDVAIEMVGKLGAKENMAELMEIYKTEQNDILKRELLLSIGKSESVDAIPFLQNILEKDPLISNHGVAAMALAQIGGKKVDTILQNAMDKENDPGAKDDIASALKRASQR